MLLTVWIPYQLDGNYMLFFPSHAAQPWAGCQMQMHGVFAGLANTDLRTKIPTQDGAGRRFSWSTEQPTMYDLITLSLSTDKCHLLFVPNVFQLAKKKKKKSIKHSHKLGQAKQKLSEHNRENKEAVIHHSRLQSRQPTTKQEAAREEMASHTPPTVRALRRGHV